MKRKHRWMLTVASYIGIFIASAYIGLSDWSFVEIVLSLFAAICFFGLVVGLIWRNAN